MTPTPFPTVTVTTSAPGDGTFHITVGAETWRVPSRDIFDICTRHKPAWHPLVWEVCVLICADATADLLTPSTWVTSTNNKTITVEL